MIATFERFDLRLTKAQARACAHPGDCEADVADVVQIPAIRRQLDRIGPDAIRAELKEYGAWDAGELADNIANRARIVWIAAGNIAEDAA